MVIAPLQGIAQTFQGRGGRTQQHRAAGALGANHRHISCRVAKTLLLFQRKIMLFIHHDEAEFRHGGKDRRSCSENHAGPTLARPLPGPLTLDIRQP